MIGVCAARFRHASRREKRQAAPSAPKLDNKKKLRQAAALERYNGRVRHRRTENKAGTLSERILTERTNLRQQGADGPPRVTRWSGRNDDPYENLQQLVT